MKKNKGFTLIELLVVIAIIGILASVVLASLNSARAKGADAAIKSNLNNARAQAELFYDGQTPNTYTGVCASTTTGIAKMVTGATTAGGTAIECEDAAGTGWAMAVGLKTTGTYWCVDSTGASKGTQASGSTSYTAVTGAATAALTDTNDVTCN